MKNFLPNTHDIHVVKVKIKKPKQKICKKCLSFTTIKKSYSREKLSWCQYYGRPTEPMCEGCKKFR